MEVLIHPTEQAMATAVADAIEQTVRSKPDAIIGLATGGTFLGCYTELIRRYEEGLSFADTTMVLLDEYLGLPPGHPQRYGNVIRREFAACVDVPDDRVLSPNADASDLGKECRRYEAQLRGIGGVDVQLLGIGRDGHVAFNEPGSSLASLTRVKKLAAETLQDNARFFAGTDELPTHGITQGIRTILRSRYLVVAAVGKHKADPVSRAIEGPVAASLPASALQLHQSVSFHLDPAAAERLELTQYYLESYEGRRDLKVAGLPQSDANGQRV